MGCGRMSVEATRRRRQWDGARGVFWGFRTGQGEGDAVCIGSVYPKLSRSRSLCGCRLDSTDDEVLASYIVLPC
eukprot:5054082-Pleurochrysis_carterae.AAC.1